jgi:hypothetical protein
LTCKAIGSLGQLGPQRLLVASIEPSDCFLNGCCFNLGIDGT